MKLSEFVTIIINTILKAMIARSEIRYSIHQIDTFILLFAE